MKMMLYVMPIVFFFILYDVPSGLLLYWIISNLLSLVQQIAINKYLAKKRASMALANPELVIAPKGAPKIAPKKKKRR
jgi:YidC/Oxa1 family membrane protein insertase